MSLILIVSQDADCRERVARTLGEAGWDVRGFAGSEDALRAAAEQAPDLVIASAAIPSIQRLLGRFARAHGGPGAIVLIPTHDVGLVTADEYQADEMLPESFSASELIYLFQRFVSSSRSRPQPEEDLLEDRLQLTSVDIFGDVLAEVEEEAQNAGEEAFPDFGKSAPKPSFTVPPPPPPQQPQPVAASPPPVAPPPQPAAPVAPPPQPAAPVAPPTPAVARPASPTATGDVQRRLEETLSGVMPEAGLSRSKKAKEKSVDDLLDRTLSSLDLGLGKKTAQRPSPETEFGRETLRLDASALASSLEPAPEAALGRETVRINTADFQTPPPAPEPPAPTFEPAAPAPPAPAPSPPAAPTGHETLRLDPAMIQQALAEQAAAEAEPAAPVVPEPVAPVVPEPAAPVVPEPAAPVVPEPAAPVAQEPSFEAPPSEVSFESQDELPSFEAPTEGFDFPATSDAAPASSVFALDEPEEEISFFPPASASKPLGGLTADENDPREEIYEEPDDDEFERTATGSIWPTEAKIEPIDEAPPAAVAPAMSGEDWSFSFADPIKPPPADPLPSTPLAAGEDASDQHNTQPFSVMTPGVAGEGQELGQYTLTKRIAVGGMAEVWMAKRRGVEGFSKTVAIKRILSHLTTSQEFITMFIDEAKLAAQLNHNHITQIYELGKFAETFFIAMEYVEGKDLRTILNAARKQQQPLPLPLALMITGCVARALDYAHRKKDDHDRELGLVHRDVSPQNVLIGYEGEIKLCDFGIAKAVVKASTTQMGALKGKLQYMSPEQAWGKTVDGRSDIFSLGSVFFEMLTGTKLFVGESEISVLDSVRECRITPPRDLVPDLPKNVEKILLKALAQSPKKRYQTAGEMEADIKEALLDYRASAGQSDLAKYMHELFIDPPTQAPPVVEAVETDLGDLTRQDRPDTGASSEIESDAAEEEAPKAGLKKKILPIFFILAILAVAVFFGLRMMLPKSLSSPADVPSIEEPVQDAAASEPDAASTEPNENAAESPAETSADAGESGEASSEASEENPQDAPPEDADTTEEDSPEDEDSGENDPEKGAEETGES